MTSDDLRRAIHEQFRLETIAMHQEWDCVEKRDHQEAAICHAKRREALNRAGALMERLA